MLAKRIVPCLDVRDGKVVKGINFIDIKEVGDPVECAMEYDRQGADEIVFLDITATHEGRGTMAEVVRRTARNVFVPLTVGGGIRGVDDFRALLRAGADKISVNSAALREPGLISEAAAVFGSQCVVVAIDAKRRGGDGGGPPRYSAFVRGGREDTGVDAVEWAAEAERRGAGEILLTSMDTDGTKEGFDLAMLDAVCAAVNIPVIASGGGGSLRSFSELFLNTGADAALAASIFHYGEFSVGDVKQELIRAGIPARM
ncbi:MAG: imidazole glycerol phosphate synthase subunit HisF [Clostridiales Family XIII bacterium]|jgi:cyclase|nr:imidazole glycerol phosphate synthase subunit HisF [Clostridiales Family XIII bacterium]